MTIAFDAAQWARIRDDYSRFWQGELDRPLCPVVIDPPLAVGETPPGIRLSQSTFPDLKIAIEQLIDYEDWRLSRQTFLHDSFPWVNMICSGPGILSAMLGANLHVSHEHGTIWFDCDSSIPIDQLHFEYDPTNIWAKRVKDFCQAAKQKWEGNVLVSFPDLGGNLDILATFRSTEQLLLDLYDHTEQVENLIWEIHEAWHAALEDIVATLGESVPGYCSWTGLYSETPMYMLQSDFSYMISPKMFGKFALPELTADCHKLPRSFYHWDGVGQLPHAEQLLSIDALDGVQWQPGAGQPTGEEWPQVFEQIRAAGKLAQLVAGPKELRKLMDSLGNGLGITSCHAWCANYSNPEEARRDLAAVMEMK